MIKANHAAQFYGVTEAWIFSDNTLIDNMSSVYECMDAVGAGKDAITKDAFKDLY